MKRIPWKKLLVAFLIAFVAIQLIVSIVQAIQEHKCNRRADEWLRKARASAGSELSTQEAAAWLRANGFEYILEGPGSRTAPGVKEEYICVLGIRELCEDQWPLKPGWLHLTFKFDL